MTAGDTFGDYTVVRLLGKGGMGEVWLLEGKSGQRIAAKILDPATATDPDARRRFLREAELALGVKHPNLVETYDVGEDPETHLCYILMEYVPGGTLADLLRRHGAMSVEDAVAVVAAMASVLELGRRKGIVHRDIKPANIMFDAAGTAKLADLGIARRCVGDETTTVTQTGAMIGTPAYMAPEQMLDSHNVDTRADIYSLGVVFFEMLAGIRPNKGDTLVQLMAKAMKGEPIPDVRTRRPDVPPPLAELLNRMVAPDRDDRIATPGRVLRELSLISVPFSRPSAEVPRGHRRFPWILLPVCLLAAIVFAGQRFGLWNAVWDRMKAFLFERVALLQPIPPAPPPVPPVPLEPRPIPSVPTNFVPVPIDPRPTPPAPPLPQIPMSDLPDVPTNPVSVPDVPLPILPTNPVPAPAILPPTVPADAHPTEPIRPRPASSRKPKVVFECEFIPFFRNWTGQVEHPEKIDSVEVRGCEKAEVRMTGDGQTGARAVVVFHGKPRDICTLTFRAGKMTGIATVQLGARMRGRKEVPLMERSK